ncbi:MAG: CBS domain-containing protein [Candidatus Xenobia bacterium]
MTQPHLEHADSYTENLDEMAALDAVRVRRLEAALRALGHDAISTLHSPAPVVIDHRSSVREAIRLMQEQKRGAALVTRDGRLAGIFTNQDLIVRVVEPGRSLDEAVGDFMTPNPVVLSRKDLLLYALNRMHVAGIRHVPLVDDEFRPDGIVSASDLIHYLIELFNEDVLNLPPEPVHEFPRAEGA